MTPGSRPPRSTPRRWGSRRARRATSPTARRGSRSSDAPPATRPRNARGRTRSIAKIQAIPDPFRDAITTPAAYPAIEAAQAAIRTVQTTIDGDLAEAVR